jgi:hypothetical protein
VTSAKGLCDAPLEASPYSGVNEKQLAVSALVVSVSPFSGIVEDFSGVR